MRKRTISSEIQQKIIIGLIVDDVFCRDVLPMLESHHVQDENAALIVKWIRDYYEDYSAAPKQHIMAIFLAEKEQLEGAQASSINKILSFLSEQYEEAVQLNWQFYFDKVRDFCRKKSLEKLTVEIKTLADVDRLDLAEKTLHTYRKIEKKTSKWFNPLTDRDIFKDCLKNEDDCLFQLPGQLGLAGFKFQRGWLGAFLAPPKVGKSWWLMELAIQAYLNKLRVVFISLEMNKEEVSERFYKRFTGRSMSVGDFPYPIWDCKGNKENTCIKPQRTNHEIFLNEDGNAPTYNPNSTYTACDYCKVHGMTEHYQVDTWYETIGNHRSLGGMGFDPIKAISRQYADNLRLLCYPRFSLSLAGLSSELDRLEQTEDFIPDVILVDYVDILSDEGLTGQGRDLYDTKWKTAASIAGERHVFLGTASQGNRGGMSKDRIQTDDLAEDIRKLAHVDILMGINQSKKADCNEKELMRQRLEMLAHRHKGATDREVYVLQNLEFGQVCLDSYCFYTNDYHTKLTQGEDYG